MTRKQALALAIQVLTETGQQAEAAETLQTISDELPLNHWTDAAIRDAVEQFILDHGRPPTVTEFKKRGMPPHPVIKLRYGVTLREWLDRDYPGARPAREELQARATEEFIQDYLRVRPTSAEDYNVRRTIRLRGWRSIARYNHTRRWSVLLEKLELPVYARRSPPEEANPLKVCVITDLDAGGAENDSGC